MALVAYDASSDEESDYGDEEIPRAIILEKQPVKAVLLQKHKVRATNDHISDEDDDYMPPTAENEASLNNLSTLLPKPKNDTSLSDILEHFGKPIFTTLPTPKVASTEAHIEEDDEFLHKKPSQDITEKPNKNIEVKKMSVKISVPSLWNFQDVEKEMSDKAKNRTSKGNTKSLRTSGLLSILPKAKSEQNFAKVNTFGGENKNIKTNSIANPAIPAFIPDAVKHRRPATNTEDIDRSKPFKNKSPNQPNKIPTQNKKNMDSDQSDNDDENENEAGPVDFFSFNTDKSLPEVSSTEINALVAKKAAEIVETTKKYLKATDVEKNTELKEMQIDEQELEKTGKRYHQENLLNSEALQALVGSSTKRRRQQEADIQVIDINSSEVLPNKDEWMRVALASSTTYQPTGVLVDEEPASGTRRKHQITYLAHKAKANEAELQAMWSANRQNRRATQSKYGF